MIESIQDIFEQVTLFDYIYIVLTILFIIQGTSKGFVLSILSAAKWILAYVVTIYVFPKAKPYVEDIIDNEYVLDIILGVGIFVVIIFLILLINKALSKVVSYSGIGTIDKVFGFLFGIVKAYVVVVCLYTAANIVYNHDKWPINLDDSFTFDWVEKGSNYLIKEFPDEKEYEEAKEKVQDI
jgi:membrane protein required for colicin V production